MGFRKHPIKQRVLIALLERNGFQFKRQSGTSHRRYEGVVDGKTRRVDVDMAHDEFSPKHDPLPLIVASQLGLGTGTDAWKRFYAGHPDTARQHGLPYKPW